MLACKQLPGSWKLEQIVNLKRFASLCRYSTLIHRKPLIFWPTLQLQRRLLETLDKFKGIKAYALRQSSMSIWKGWSRWSCACSQTSWCTAWKMHLSISQSRCSRCPGTKQQLMTQGMIMTWHCCRCVPHGKEQTGRPREEPGPCKIHVNPWPVLQTKQKQSSREGFDGLATAYYNFSESDACNQLEQI